MNRIWFRELGFHNNPFSIKPAVFHDDLESMQSVIDRLIFTVLKGKIAYVEGDYGEGKTTVLKRLVNEFGGKKQVVYFSCNRVEKVDASKLIKNRHGLLGKIFHMEGKDLILLLDEAQELTKAETQEIIKFHQSGNFKAIILVGASHNKKAFGKDWEYEHIKLNKVPADKAVKIIRKRIGTLPLLPDEIVKEVYNRVSGQNIRQLLKDCEALCRYGVEYGYDIVDPRVVKEALGVFIPSNEEKEAPKEEAPKEKKVKKKATKKTTKKEEDTAKATTAKKEQVINNKEEQIYVPENAEVEGAAMEEMLSLSTDELIGEDKYY